MRLFPEKLNSKFLLGLLLTGLLAWPALAQSGQVAYSSLQLQGSPVQSISLYGSEYVSIDDLSRVAQAQEEGPYVRIVGLGHNLLLPIDSDAYRATTSFNTIQLDGTREQGRAATIVDGAVHVPLEVVARTFGAEYRTGYFSLPSTALLNVSSSVGDSADRLVLDLSRDTEVYTEMRGNDLHVVMQSASGEQKRYTTTGKYITNARVVGDGGNLRLRFSMPKNSGYRMYKVIRPGNVRVVVDAGPAIERTTPALVNRIAKPLIAIEPVPPREGMADHALDTAKKLRSLLRDAGWEVKLTREDAKDLGTNEKIALARQSDVYLMFDVGHSQAPENKSGLTVYQQIGLGSTEYVKNVRGGATPAYAANAVGDLGGTRVLSRAVASELRERSIAHQDGEISRVLTLGEAPQAALFFELGQDNNPADMALLSDGNHRQNLATAVARSVATYLSTKAQNAAALPSGGEQ